MSGAGPSATITYVALEDYPSFRVWGMNDDDVASVTVNGIPYPLNAGTAAYDAKVVWGLSPGPDRIIFSNGNFTGANSNIAGNYSYQNIQLAATGVSTVTITSLNGAGWGFAGASFNCPVLTSIASEEKKHPQIRVTPNPFS